MRGVSPYHSGTLKGVQRLSLHNLPVTADHFRCHMRSESLGKVLLASLAVTRMKNGFKIISLAVGEEEVTPQSLGDGQVWPVPALGLFLEHPLNGARLMP